MRTARGQWLQKGLENLEGMDSQRHLAPQGGMFGRARLDFGLGSVGKTKAWRMGVGPWC